MKTKTHFTLIELIIAAVLFVIAIIGIPTFYVANHRNLRRARLKRLATWQAIYKMEKVKSMDYSAIQPDPDEGIYVETINPEEEQKPQYKKVKVIVSEEDNGLSNELSILTYISDN